MKYLFLILTFSVSFSAQALRPIFDCKSIGEDAEVTVEILQDVDADRFVINYSSSNRGNKYYSEEIFRSEEGWHDQRLKQHYNMVIDFYANRQGLFPAIFEEFFLFKKDTVTELLCERIRY